MCVQGNRLYQRAHIFIADDYKTRWHAVIVGIGSRQGKGPTKWEGPTVTACHLVYVIIIRLLYKVNPSERILDVTLLELSDEVIESK